MTTPLRLVLIEDFPDLRALIGEFLARDGRFEVAAEGETGEDAISLARDLQPDVVLMDIHLPVLDGDAALPDVQAAAPSTRVVLYSGSPAEQYAHLGVPVIEKSMYLDRFVAALADAVGLDPSPRPAAGM